MKNLPYRALGDWTDSTTYFKRSMYGSQPSSLTDDESAFELFGHSKRSLGFERTEGSEEITSQVSISTEW